MGRVFIFSHLGVKKLQNLEKKFNIIKGGIGAWQTIMFQMSEEKNLNN